MTPEQLAGEVRLCLAAAGSDGDLPLEASQVEVSVRPAGASTHADFTSPVALQLAGLGLDPCACAEVLAARLRTVPDLAAVEVAGAGHLNMTVRLDALVATAQAAVAPEPAAVPVPRAAPLTGTWQAVADRVGPDVARWVRAQDPAGDPEDLDLDRLLARTLDNAAFRVLFAHARAASALHAAAALGVDWRRRRLQGSELTGPPGRPLLVAIATCAGGLGAPATGPQGLARRLEALATTYLGFDATGPALPVGAAVEPSPIARAWLAAATRNQLATGLARLGIVAPERI